jgi:beta-phosphoglucomutase
MAHQFIPGLGEMTEVFKTDLIELSRTSEGEWQVGREGVIRILTPLDRKVEFIIFADKALALLKSALGQETLYPLQEARFESPAQAVLMDLDGTSVHSEHFWMWIIQKTMARLMGNSCFVLRPEDEPQVSGHSVSEHLQYCLNKYCPELDLSLARRHYYEITEYEMSEIMAGRGRVDAFHPSPGLKDFLLELKGRGIKIGLVTSGLYQKAWPEILSAFRVMGMGSPLDFYDAIITAGDRVMPGQTGTLGELSPKPHPWLYAETAYVGLGISREQRHRVVGLEDSGAGVVAIRLAGFSAIGLAGGNIAKSGVRPLLHAECATLSDALPVILGRS